MADVNVLTVEDTGRDDVLRVTGTVDGQFVEAVGWVSATTNHYPASAYNSDGSRDESVPPAKMTRDGVIEYATGLLVAASNPVSVSLI